MTTLPPAFHRFGLSGDVDERALKRAYARELKQIDQENDVAGFQALREAYEAALGWLRYQAAHAADGVDAADSAPAHGEAPEAVAPAPSAQPTEPPVAHVVNDPTPEASQDAPPHPAQVAEAHFQAFVQTLAQSITSADEALQLLERTLQDEAMIAIDARDWFEWLTACRLANGWQPGNEALFSVAVDYFQWKSDRRRLLRFNQVGAYLDRGIHELIAFNAQGMDEREQSMATIRRLRSPTPPSRKELRNQVPVLNQLVYHHPTLLAIITSGEQVEHWLSEGREFRQLAPPAPRQAHSNKAPKSGVNYAFIIAGIVLIRLAAALFSPDSTSSSSAYHPPPAPSTSHSLAPFSIPDTPAPSFHADKPLLSEVALAELANMRVNLSNCSYIATVAQHNEIDMSARFNHNVIKLAHSVVGCIDARYWPLPERNTPFVQAAMSIVKRP